MRVGPRAKLLLVFALFAAPIVASLLAYRYAHVAPTANHGELLLPPAQVPDRAMEGTGGKPFSFGALRGRWILVAVDAGACGEPCVAKLVAMRQVRLALGVNASRVARVFLADDARAPDEAALAAFPGMERAVLPPGTALGGAPAWDRRHVYLVDPNGNVMMRWRAGDDPKGMLRDLERLLRASQIG
jgi:cytochrome oxidase Cu insertion factor (SCO1/SenC/PrrC family)